MLVNRFVVSVYFSVTSVLALFYVCINDIKLFYSYIYIYIYIYIYFFVNLEFTVNKDTYNEKFIFN